MIFIWVHSVSFITCTQLGHSTSTWYTSQDKKDSNS